MGSRLPRPNGAIWPPKRPCDWESFARIERSTVERAQFSIFTTPSAVANYRACDPHLADRFSLLENGYDGDIFSGIQGDKPQSPGQLTLLHSCLEYTAERNPTQLFEALGHLRASAPDIYVSLRLRFREPMHDDLLRRLALRNDVEEAIEILPRIGYCEALTEMLRADGLLLLQASNCNAQAPTKF